MSSKTSVPMEPAPPSLIERLRTEWINDDGTLCELAADRIEALDRVVARMSSRCQTLETALLSKANTHADEGLVQYENRIEELERAIWQMHSEAHEHIKRIEELEKRWDLQVDNAVRMAADRIEALEAALRGIGETNSYAGILARRALESKP